MLLNESNLDKFQRNIGPQRMMRCDINKSEVGANGHSAASRMILAASIDHGWGLVWLWAGGWLRPRQLIPISNEVIFFATWKRRRRKSAAAAADGGGGGGRRKPKEKHIWNSNWEETKGCNDFCPLTIYVMANPQWPTKVLNQRQLIHELCLCSIPSGKKYH